MATRQLFCLPSKPTFLGQRRAFSPATIHLKAKKAEQHQDAPEPFQQTSTPDPLDAVKLPTSLKKWEAFSYSDFMAKVQKKNPEVKFTKQLADSALEKFASIVMPSHTWKMAMRQLNGGATARRRTDQAMIRDWKRLQSGSEAYWEENDGDGPKQ